MYVVGNLNLNIFNCIFDGIDGTEVIITEERIKHIQERHPTDFDICNTWKRWNPITY